MLLPHVVSLCRCEDFQAPHDLEQSSIAATSALKHDSYNCSNVARIISIAPVERWKISLSMMSALIEQFNQGKVCNV